jgi:hypothetical protein
MLFVPRLTFGAALAFAAVSSASPLVEKRTVSANQITNSINGLTSTVSKILTTANSINTKGGAALIVSTHQNRPILTAGKLSRLRVP